MKYINTITQQNYYSFLFVLLFFGFGITSYASVSQKSNQQGSDSYTQYYGTVVNAKTSKPLVFASLIVNNTNISTITNSEGEFTLKIPSNIENVSITVLHLGYHKKVVPINDLKNKKIIIKMHASVTKLSEVILKTPKDAKSLVRSVFKSKATNNLDKQAKMTAFYRETIKKRKKNASLSEAVVSIYKQPNTSNKKDRIKLLKARKSTDYSRLDTIAVKLQGGPFNALYIDLMKYPHYLFTESSFDLYQFTFANSTSIDDRFVYVVNFKQLSYVKEPMYYGKLYVDAKSHALTSAIFHLNVSNKELVSKLFVKRKPKDVDVSPISIAYRVDYLEKDNKWYYSYSNAQLTFKVKRKKKLFSSIYSLYSEMVVTDWQFIDKKESLKYNENMKKSIIISDEVSGFTDPEFWGSYNVIEPEKSIQSAIKKIKKQMRKMNK